MMRLALAVVVAFAQLFPYNGPGRAKNTVTLAYSLPTSAVASTTNASSYAFSSFTPSASAILTIETCMTGNTGTFSISSSAGASLTWTAHATTASDGTNKCMLFWARTSPNPSASTFQVDTNNGNASGAGIAIKQWTGADTITASPIKQVVAVTNGSASTTPTWTVSTLDTNDGYASFFWNTTNVAGVTGPSTWTRDVNLGYATPTTGWASATKITGLTGTSVAWGSTSTAWRGITYEVYASGTGP